MHIKDGNRSKKWEMVNKKKLIEIILTCLIFDIIQMFMKEAEGTFCFHGL